MPKLTPTRLGLIFLIPGLLLSIPALLTGHFQGAVMGCGMFSTVFGGLMCLTGMWNKVSKLEP
ncbi:MAG: hypothetical protein WCK51_04885 [Armatimonadota bacterium]